MSGLRSFTFGCILASVLTGVVWYAIPPKQVQPLAPTIVICEPVDVMELRSRERFDPELMAPPPKQVKVK